MAHAIDKGSQPVGKGELELFKTPATQVATERSRFLTFFPKNAVSETNVDSSIIFEISGIPDYLDLNKNLLKVRFQFRKANGDALDANVEVAPINYISNSFIKQCKIFLNNKQISDGSETYMLRSYIETLINFSSDIKNTRLRASGWYEDGESAGGSTVDAATNPGFMARKIGSRESRTFEVLGSLHGDIFNQTTYMLPNIKLRVELQRNSHKCVLKKFPAPNADVIDYKLHLLSVEWIVRTVEVNKSLALSHEKKLLREPAKYILNRATVKTFPLSTNTKDVQNLEIYNAQLPTKMLVTFLSTDAFDGHSSKSPFNFQHFGLESAYATVGGRRWPVEKPLEMDFDGDKVTEAYYHFLNNSGFAGSFSDSNGITLDMYKKRCFFLAFDFRSDEKDDDDAVDIIKYGETRLFLRFKAGLPAPTHLIAYLNFDNILRIDSGRNAIMDYAV
jgi:hypothetical protein